MKNYLFNKSEGEIESHLKRLWRCDVLKMIGTYQHSASPREKEFGYITNLYINDRTIFYPKNQHKRTVAIRVQKSDNLVEGNYYSVSAKVAPKELREQLKNPYLLLWDDSQPIIPNENFLSPPEFIEDWFQKTGSSPKDAATIASQLKLNSLELYTQTERFIFELIQNADDMPASEKGVQVELHLLNNFLLFRHNGKFFEREDVKAIADAAQSNKSENVRQTGYKGIGFKSVFTDSSCVYIRSGSYSFKFDKNAHIYSNFWSLYSRELRLLENSPRELAQFKLDYEHNKHKYNNIDNIPWQIKPIWVKRKEIPEELFFSEFSKHAEVNIALDIGENTIKAKNYAVMIENILSKPKFILFLRNTTKFDYYKLNENELAKQQTIELKEQNNLIDILHNEEHFATFSKIYFDIKINNEEFKNAGFDIEKYEEKPGLNKFKDEFGEIKSIPEKLGSLSSTRITFASQIKDDDIVKLEKSQSILYNYLPTSDQRFGFPFLINADFITNTSREFILKENKWNHYLMFHIGKKCIECIAKLVTDSNSTNKTPIKKYINSYLRLLPDRLLNDKDEELGDINKAFNRGIYKSLDTVAFIVTYKNCLEIRSNIIIDESGLSEIISSDFFIVFTNTPKKLPHNDIDKTNLTRAYLEIERFKEKDLINILSDKDKQHEFSKQVKTLNPQRYDALICWLDKLIHNNDIEQSWLLNFPFIRSGNKVVNLSECLNNANYIFRTKKTSEVESILEKIGFEISEFHIDNDNFRHIEKILLSTESYLQSDQKLYAHISKNGNFKALTSIEKAKIIQFFKELHEVDKARYGNLPLFKSHDSNKELKPLSYLISNQIKNIPKWLQHLVIDPEEEKELYEVFQKLLIKTNDWLEKIYCNEVLFKSVAEQLDPEDLSDFYAHLVLLEKEFPEDKKLTFNNIPWLYCAKEKIFKLPSEVYAPDNFSKLSIEDYQHVSKVIMEISEEDLTCYDALQILKPFKLGCKKDLINTIYKTEGVFKLDEMKSFLNWVEEKDFFEVFEIEKDGEKYKLKKSKGTRNYYTSKDDLKSLIEKSELTEKLKLLPSELYNQERIKIGLLDG
ncbi:sacsin N-terminal ATP-binding-like domain-containing protein [Mesoflavibacter zeaxanthinifaciens]|uniref:sacsin N-terminal ATP-binding-like domain-containing protein n=1 Tax=Mesoflavibacter zeaxanthinifaciens TaxID=393060 RepID=UPI0004067262|nr:hypothetical protein [Mesoflavibacter zeaxanthinifaciens]